MAYNIYGSNNLERATFRSKAHPKSETVPGFSKDMCCCFYYKFLLIIVWFLLFNRSCSQE